MGYDDTIGAFFLHGYTFRKMTRADFPSFHDPIAQPFIGDYGSDAESELALIGAEIDVGPTDMRIAECNGALFAYVQNHEVHAYETLHYADFTQSARSRDRFLGDLAFREQDHAACYQTERAQHLITAGAPLFAIDPESENRRAIATYHRAWFAPLALRPTQDGTPVLGMTFRKKPSRHG